MDRQGKERMEEIDKELSRLTDRQQSLRTELNHLESEKSKLYDEYLDLLNSK